MKRIVSYILALFLVNYASAQILSPMGLGLPEAPDKITAFKEGLAVSYTSKSNVIEVQIWNGYFWNQLPRPVLPQVNAITGTELQTIDLLSFNEHIYLLSAYSNNLDGTQNYISKWDGQQWTNFSNTLISTSLTLNKLFVQDDILKCVGKFKNGTEKYNILSYTGGLWIPEGNLITNNLNSDQFNSIAQSGDRLFATGKFTNPRSNNISLAIWEHGQWQPADLPPFLGKNIALGNYNGQVVVFGKSDFNNQSIKISAGKLWGNMSEGLENFDVKNIKQFAQIGSKLFAVGEFVNTTTSLLSNIMSYDGTQWSETKLNLSDIEQLYSWNNNIIVSGDFSDNARLRGIGTIYTDRAQISARVFNDKNGNCSKETDEEWLPNYPMQLKGKPYSFFTDMEGQLYIHVQKGEVNINANQNKYFSPTCPDTKIDISEYKTYYGNALGVKQKSGVVDIATQITDYQGYAAEINDKKTAQLCVSNTGSEHINGAKVILLLGNGISSSSFTSDIPYNYASNDTVIWNVNIKSNTSICIQVSYTISDNLGMTLDVEAKLPVTLSDIDPSNNFSSLTYKVGASQNNFKHCLNGMNIPSNTESMQYKVGFKNLSDYYVSEVKVVDRLDTDFRLSSKGVHIATSHVGNTSSMMESVLGSDGHYERTIITTFSNVTISPYEIDKSHSTGFVDYDINIVPNKISLNTEICNTARIFFKYQNGSFGEAIVTNTVCSVVNETIGTSNNTPLPSNISYLKIGPNPVSSYIHFDNASSEEFTIEIVNALGQKVRDFTIGSHSERKLNVQNLTKGVYVIYSNGLFAKKIVLH